MNSNEIGVFVVEQAPVYRSGISGRRYLTRSAAIVGYAKSKFRRKHPCECESSDYTSGYPGYDCCIHDAEAKVVPRFVRRLRRALKMTKGVRP